MEEGKEERKKEIEELMERAEARTKDKWTDTYRDLTLIDDNTQCNSLQTCFEPGHMVIVGETLTTYLCEQHRQIARLTLDVSVDPWVK